ncbi:hypothetical protein MMC29_004058 [Sticta canariensis]|nr:hypothetical protein [Sticta canariensis]
MTSRRNSEACANTTNKRLRDPEEEPLSPTENAAPAKRAKTIISDEPQRLTVESLKQHTLREGHLDILELMDSEADKRPKSRGSKRSASRLGIGDGSIATSSRGPETASQATQKSSFTAAHYRHSILRDANIHFEFQPPPEDIHTLISAIVQLEISPERKNELSLIGKKFHEDFADVLKRASREDDCIELFYQVLSSLGYNKSLTLPRKADWQPSLKPRTRPTKLKFNHLYRLEDDTQESVEPPSKRRQGGGAYPSPDTSGATITAERMGPPSISRSELKTPRPDISIGLDDAAVRKALQLGGVLEAEAKDLLRVLAKPDPGNGGMSLLCSEPTQSSLEIRFPFFVVEGKSYATSRAIYEAQNQAAVSGACSLKILHDLDDLVYKSDPESYSKRQPIMFSVCTEGPIHQLWVHYTTDEVRHNDSDRLYCMAQVKTCDVGIRNDVLGFLEAVDNVMRWGSSKHKETIAEQLKTINDKLINGEAHGVGSEKGGLEGEKAKQTNSAGNSKSRIT